MSISQGYGDLEIIDFAEEEDQEALRQARDDFLRSNIESFTTNSKTGAFFNEGEISQVLNLTFEWVLDIEKSKNRLEKARANKSGGIVDPENEYRLLDSQKVKTLRLESFINDLDNIESLCQNLRKRDVFNLFEFTESSEEYNI